MNELLKGKLKQIEDHAYYLWVEAGKPDGMSDYFWFQAEKYVEQKTEEQLLSHDSPPTDWSLESISPCPGEILTGESR